MTVYLDTSVILSRFLGQANGLRRWGGWLRVYTSELTRVEYLRTVDRLRLNGAIEDETAVDLHARFDVLWHTVHRVPLRAEILARAADAFPTVIGALDALHLSSALAARVDCGGDLTLLTHDRQLARTALALGLKTDGIARAANP